jgi:hypothetical protein
MHNCRICDCALTGHVRFCSSLCRKIAKSQQRQRPSYRAKRRRHERKRNPGYWQRKARQQRARALSDPVWRQRKRVQQRECYRKRRERDPIWQANQAKKQLKKNRQKLRLLSFRLNRARPVNIELRYLLNRQRRRQSKCLWAKEKRRKQTEIFAALRDIGWLDTNYNIIADPTESPQQLAAPSFFSYKLRREQKRLAQLGRRPAIRGVIFSVDRAGITQRIVIDQHEYRNRFYLKHYRRSRSRPQISFPTTIEQQNNKLQSIEKTRERNRKRVRDPNYKKRLDVKLRASTARRMRRLKKREIILNLRAMGWLDGYDLTTPPAADLRPDFALSPRFEPTQPD